MLQWINLQNMVFSLCYMTTKIHEKFRSFLPIVIDIETGGIDPEKDALLELAAIIVLTDHVGNLVPQNNVNAYHILPFEGANINPKALEINQIDPYHPFRFAITEKELLIDLSKIINHALEVYKCKIGVLVGHNAWFDLSFLKSAMRRTNIKLQLHDFTTLDTATLSAATYGQTALAKALAAAKIPFNQKESHSAIYDAQKTAELFCKIINNISINKKARI